MSSDLIGKFIENFEGSNGKKNRFKSRLRNFEDFLGEKFIEGADREDVDEYLNQLGGKGKAKSTISAHLSTLRRFFDWADSSGRIDEAPDLAGLGEEFGCDWVRFDGYMPGDLKFRLREESEKRGMSMSQIVNIAVNKFLEEGISGKEVDLPPGLLNDVEEIKESLTEVAGHLEEIDDRTNFLLEEHKSKVERIVERIEELLEEKGPLTAMGIAENLPFTISDVRLGLEQGRKKFMFKEIEPENSEAGNRKYDLM